jgi:acyl carrier protein phosphodiesterase
MRHVFNGLSKRAKFESKMEQGVPILIKHELELYRLFKKFYPDLEEASREHLNTLMKE